MKLNNLYITIMMNKINSLPEELCRIIYDFIPLSTKSYLSKNNFQFYYQRKINELDFNNYKKHDRHIRDIIRNGRETPFSLIIKSSLSIWKKDKVWKWKNKTFPNYLIYVKHLTITYNQTNLRNLINEKIKKDLGINKYKKIRTNNILWSS